jgi:hypothetical protein
MNIQRLPQPVLTFAPANWDNGYAVSNVADEKLGKIAMQYAIGGDMLYLHCRGTACDRDGASLTELVVVQAVRNQTLRPCR